MNNYKIRVIIEDRWGGVVAEAVAPMDKFLQETIQPLKLSDGPYALFDTPPETVQRVRADRETTAKILTPKITKVLLDAMSAKDLFNGYKKDET
jgi:hypothetical protein